MKTNIPTTTIPLTKAPESFMQIPELYPIPTDRIIDKTITGIGATYAEITYKQRNSIIIMPNVSIIISKHRKHHLDDNTLAVHGKVPDYVIREYLDNRIYPKKLLITPEAFKRVKKIVDAKGVNIFNDYFLLIDESHKTIKDVGYRDRIAEPMKHFFQFNGKALITATNLVPSDPRFANHNFRLLKVKPLYTRAKPLQVTHVSDIIKALKNYFNENDAEQHCVFLNSVTAIKRVIELLKLKQKSSIFCSAESALDLKNDGWQRIYSQVSALSKFNFFTSSFYNGLDIEFGSKPDILIITDMAYPQTAVDPFTDVQQIIGRFRKNAFRKATHFYTDNWKIRVETQEQLATSINLKKQIYDAVQALQMSIPAVAFDEHLSNVLKEEMQRQFYSRFIYDGETNYFKIDNYLNDQRVLGYYQSADRLKAAYAENSAAFDLHFTTASLLARKDEHLKIKSGRRYSVENIRKVANALQLLSHNKESDEYKETLKYYTQKALEALLAFERLGYEEMECLGFRRNGIKKALILHDYTTKRNWFPVIDLMHYTFITGKFHSCASIKTKIVAIYNEFGVPKPQPTAAEIMFFFDGKAVTSKIKGKSVKGYILYAPKQNQHLDYQRN